jgi:hypothetical protein
VLRPILSLAPIFFLVAQAATSPAKPRDVAREAVDEIEKMTRYIRIEGNEGLGLDYKEGRTRILLDEIVESPNAGEYLAQLSRSRNVVSRMVAAEGFGDKKSEQGREILQKLKNDHSTADVVDGGERNLVSVADFARQSLRRYLANQPLPQK